MNALLMNRQSDGDRSASSLFAGNFNRAVMQMNQLVADRQPEPRALGLLRKKRGEDFFQILVFDAGAGVFEQKFQMSAVLTHFKPDRSLLLGKSLIRIDEDIIENVDQLQLIGGNQKILINAVFAVDRNVRIMEAVPDRGHAIFKYL